MNERDFSSEELNMYYEMAAKGLLRKVGKGIWMVFGKYILLALAILLLVSILIVLVLFIPSLSFKNSAKKLTGADSVPDAVTVDWGNPLGPDVDAAGSISSTFGPRQKPNAQASAWHKGIDIAVVVGTPVYAGADGTVTVASDRGNGGLCVYIETNDGYIFRYMHLNEINVSVGQAVSKGDLIGKSGNTGNSTGPHLHYEIQAPEGIGTKADNGNWYLDPAQYLDGSSSTGSGSAGGVNPVNPEEYWYNAENVKNRMDELFETISDMNTGMLYITKDNFTMILDKVIDYAKSVRKVTNAYTYYHHFYNKEVKYAYEKVLDEEGEEISDGSESVSGLGEGEEEGVNEEDRIDNEYVDDDGNKHEIHYVWRITDRERKDELGHIINESPENDPIFKISWEEIFTMAAMKSVVQDAREDNWITDATLQEVERPNIDGIERLDEATVKQIIDAFEFEILYYFDPTSGDTMPGTSETYASHTYQFDEMEDFAYIKSKEGVNVEHGTETFDTPAFDYYEYKKPAIAPAYAANAYTTIEYDYTENADGTATLAGRQVIVDGQKFYAYVKDILGEDFKMEWFVQFLCMLPGSNYDAGNGTLESRFNQILQSYKDGTPYSYYDSNIQGVGEITLGTSCPREPKPSTRRDENGNPIDDTTQTTLNITVNDIDDEQIRKDIQNGLYTLEDLVYAAACAQAEAGSVDGQVAVVWLLRNRIRLGGYSSIKAAVTASGQFASGWASYLNGSYSAQAQSCAAAVLKGEVANPIGNAYFFFSASSVWGHKPGVFYINVGGNMFYEKWGDVTQVVDRSGYVPF